ncbi:hypothetical protein BDM02DRAFT_3258888 [Thelephora ganbajun]|uniref:Uncharacterized protein n=1 Tax=Thelephora ganbajun TaxID=370292 RepID=A0ACB6ZQQ1_THEGA|nr:hypothetical protein BDM02DRAFT_3258888 [Thelephora ganbajun]
MGSGVLAPGSSGGSDVKRRLELDLASVFAIRRCRAVVRISHVIAGEMQPSEDLCLGLLAAYTTICRSLPQHLDHLSVGAAGGLAPLITKLEIHRVCEDGVTFINTWFLPFAQSSDDCVILRKSSYRSSGRQISAGSIRPPPCRFWFDEAASFTDASLEYDVSESSFLILSILKGYLISWTSRPQGLPSILHLHYFTLMYIHPDTVDSRLTIGPTRRRSTFAMRSRY